MQTQVTKKIDFTGKNLFIGLDVHKKSWSVTIVVDGIEHRTFTQPPDTGALFYYLQRMFPGGSYNSAYEAGFCGYGIHRELNSLGIKNIAINAADIPTTQKDKLQKRDPVDSRKIARSLEKGSLHGIHIFDRELEELRTLLIEASWQAVRMDPAMMQYYHKHLVNNKGHKVIIKVARKLLNRIRYVMKNRQPYITGVV
jgi:transposase